MNHAWPPPRLQALVEALPWDHCRRGLGWEAARSRWQTESDAARAAGLPPTTLLMRVGGECEAWLRTLACWNAQSAPTAGWWVVGETDEPWRAQREALGLPAPRGCVRQFQAALAVPSSGWALCANGGDLLHPSLAWMVALAARDGAGALYWDWLEYSESADGLALHARMRAPWRDWVRELRDDVRGRAFAMPVAAWEGLGNLGTWDIRMRGGTVGSTAPASLHPEPLAMYDVHSAGPSRVPAARALAQAEAHWGVPFELRADGTLQPAAPARSVSVVLMYRDRPELTVQAIQSVSAQRTQAQVELVLVDNASSMASRAVVEAALRTLPPGLRVTRLDAPGPFNHSGQAAHAVRAAQGEVLLLLNNDARLLQPDALDQLARWALLPGVASAGVAVVDAAGQVVGGGMRARRLPGAEFNSPVEEVRGAEGRDARECIGNSFACAAMSVAAWRSLGGLDAARFPAGYNDVDYCLRAAAAGWRHVNLGHVQVEHHVGASRGRQDEIAQKAWLRMRHPWVAGHALQEFTRDALDALLPAPPRLACGVAGRAVREMAGQPA